MLVSWRPPNKHALSSAPKARALAERSSGSLARFLATSSAKAAGASLPPILGLLGAAPITLIRRRRGLRRCRSEP